MRFKAPLSQVMCLVITMILHSARAQNELTSIEALFNKTLTKFEQNIIEKLQVQNKEVIEKVVDSVNNLRNISENILAGQSEIQKQLENLTNHLQHNRSHVEQERANENDFHLVESIKNLQNITDNLEASLSDVGHHLTNESVERGNQSSKDVISESCATLNINETGTYYIRPAEDVEPFLVFCDFGDNFNLGGGWTVFQRRFNGSVNFFQNWTMYKNGFGDVNGEHWLGLEKLHLMTRSGRHEMLVILEDYEGRSVYAHYDRFQIGSEAEKYKLTVGNYLGTAGGDSLSYHNGNEFSTFDQDNDEDDSNNCATIHIGAWWFGYCALSHLNGKYRRKGEHLETQYHGVIWYHWKGSSYSLKSTKMMLRRRSG